MPVIAGIAIKSLSIRNLCLNPKLSIGLSTLHILCQFVFLADIVSLIVLTRKFNKEKSLIIIDYSYKNISSSFAESQSSEGI